MYILNLYVILGVINNCSITFYENKNNENKNNENKNNTNENNTNENNTNENNTIVKNICSYTYQFCIFALLLYNPIYHLLNNNNIYNIGFILYKFNYVVHFLFLYINFHKILKYKYLDNKNFNIILILSQIVILCSFIVNTYLMYKFKFISYSLSWFFHILINLSEFYGIFIYINSIILFILIFIKLSQDIYIIKIELENNITYNKKKGLIKFFHNIINLKNISTYTICDFNYILNLFTLINIFSIGLIYNIYSDLSYNRKIYFYILCSYFLIIEIICLSIILFISKTRQNIFSKIYNPLFINKFIKKYDLNTFNDSFDIELDINSISVNDITLYNILEDNSTSIDWIILNITLTTKWMDFNLFGVEIHSLNCIAKILFIITLFYKIIQL